MKDKGKGAGWAGRPVTLQCRWHLVKEELGRKSLRWQSSSQTASARPVRGPWPKLSHESHIHSNSPTMLNHWLGIVRVKHDLAMNMVSNPKGQQLRLPVNQIRATKVKEVDQKMGGFRQGEELQQRPMGGKYWVNPRSDKPYLTQGVGWEEGRRQWPGCSLMASCVFQRLWLWTISCGSWATRGCHREGGDQTWHREEKRLLKDCWRCREDIQRLWEVKSLVFLETKDAEKRMCWQRGLY